METTFSQNLWKLEHQRAMVHLQLQVIDSKLKEGQKIQANIERIQQNPAFIGLQDIDKESEEIKEVMIKASVATELIGIHEKDPDYLAQDQIEFLEYQVLQFKCRSYINTKYLRVRYFHPYIGT